MKNAKAAVLKTEFLKRRSKRDLGYCVICCSLFAVLFALLLRQYSKVWIYYDDYGYLALNYALNSWDVHGHEWTFAQLLYFIRWSFVYSNGRQLVMFLYLLIFKLAKLDGVRLVVAILAWLTAFLPMLLLRKLASVKKVSVLAVLLLTSVFALLSATFQAEGAYWFAAAFPYIVPAVLIYLPMVCIAHLYKKSACVKGGQLSVCIFTALVAGFTQEQYYVANIVLTGCALCASFLPESYVGLHIKSCRIKLAAMLAAAFVGGTPILMCPAAHNRMHKSDWYALDAAGKLSANITMIMRRFFSSNRCYVLLVTALFLIMLTMLIFKTKDILARIIHVLATAFAIYVTLFYCVMNQMGFYECDTWLYFAYLVVMSVELLGFLLGRGEFILAFSYLAASASIGCLILVPSNDIQFRCILPYIFLSMPTFAYIIQQASDLAAIGRLKTARKLWYGCVAGLMAVFWLLGLHNMQNIYAGYSMNETVNEYNDGCMYKAAEEYWSDGTLPDIVLYQLPDTVCRGRMQYEQGFEGISKWMAEYYDLPREIKITWRNDTMSSFVLA